MEPGADELRERLAKTWASIPNWEALDPTASCRIGAYDATVAASPDRALLRSALMAAGAEQGPGAMAAGAPAGYEFLAELGRGGMGVVYRARQNSLSREVAVKLIRPDVASPAAESLFMAEAVATGLLSHPNIVQVHDVSRGPAGEPLLAMQLVGGTAWKWLLHPRNEQEKERASRLELADHLQILLSVCNAIAFAHSRGIVHRDLKPDNVMIGEFGEVLVMDWGLAVEVSEPRSSATALRHKSSLTGKFPEGTPAYMSPELALCLGGETGPRTDVYLLGAILCEVLTGSPPHRRETVREVLVSASLSEPVALPAETPREIREIVHRAMARKPEDRFATAGEFQEALRGFLRHRESVRLCDAAAARLKKGVIHGDPRTLDIRRVYFDYADIQSRFRQALELWPQNHEGRAGLKSAILALMEAAIAGGDLGLAEAQIAELAITDLERKSAAVRISQLQRQQSAQHARTRRLGVLLWGAVIIVLAGLAATPFVLLRMVK